MHVLHILVEPGQPLLHPAVDRVGADERTDRKQVFRQPSQRLNFLFFRAACRAKLQRPGLLFQQRDPERGRAVPIDIHEDVVDAEGKGHEQPFLGAHREFAIPIERGQAGAWAEQDRRPLRWRDGRQRRQRLH